MQLSQEDSHHEYFIVIQMAAGLSAFQPRPALPPNAKFVEHANECFDWGTIGWLLSTSQLDYTYAPHCSCALHGSQGHHLSHQTSRSQHATEAVMDTTRCSQKASIQPTPAQPLL